MKNIGFWSNIMKMAKECGYLRLQGKYEEADKLQKENEKIIKMYDKVVLDVDRN